MKKHPPTVIFIGLSGSGKGTQARLLAEKYNFEYIEIGKLLRAEAKKDTEFGRKVNQIINIEGKLLPDQMVYEIIKRKFVEISSDKKVIFDGYPRTIQQVWDLDKMLAECDREVYLVFNIQISDQEALKRLSKRLICGDCKAVFQENNLKIGSECPKCGGKIIKRKDDTPEKIKTRLAWAHKELKPVIEHYQKKGILVNINGERDPKIIHRDLVQHLAKN